jgi:MHS family proline/betaine transporter-like MFS transporter
MQSSNTRRVIAAGAIGNVLEWYDFAVYGYFATAIGAKFFPREDAVAQVLAAFGIFAIGYLMRPVGGAIVGHIGDRLGRRAALTFSVTAMAVPTFLIGVLPGYETMGIMAPVALTFLRMVQGLSVGGEYTTSIVFMVENAPPGRRGVVGSLGCCGAVGGILLGSTVGAILAKLMPTAVLEDWGWRIPFLMGLILGGAGYLLRRHMADEPVAVGTHRGPLIDTLQLHRKLLARLAGLSLFNAVSFYLVFVYVVSWLQMVDGIAPASALGVNTISMLALFPVMIGTARLSDRIGRKPVLMAGILAGFFGAVPFFWLMHHQEPYLILLGQLGFVVCVGTYIGCLPVVMVEATPKAVRCTAIALGYNLCLGIFGGLTPLVATWLVHRTANEISPAFMVMGAAVVSFLAVLTFRETSQSPTVDATL